MPKLIRAGTALALAWVIGCAGDDAQGGSGDPDSGSYYTPPTFGAGVSTIVGSLRANLPVTNATIKAVLAATEALPVAATFQVTDLAVVEDADLEENEVVAITGYINWRNILTVGKHTTITNRIDWVDNKLNLDLLNPAPVRASIEQEGTEAKLILSVQILGASKEVALTGFGTARMAYESVGLEYAIDQAKEVAVAVLVEGFVRPSNKDRWLQLNEGKVSSDGMGGYGFEGEFPWACSGRNTGCEKKWDVLGLHVVNIANGKVELAFADGAIDEVKGVIDDGTFGPSGSSFTIDYGEYGISRDEIAMVLVPKTGALTTGISSRITSMVKIAAPGVADDKVNAFVTGLLKGFQVEQIAFVAAPTELAISECVVQLKLVGADVELGFEECPVDVGSMATAIVGGIAQDPLVQSLLTALGSTVGATVTQVLSLLDQGTSTLGQISNTLGTPSCPGGMVLEGLFCYPPCPSGFRSDYVGACYRECPAGSSWSPGFCNFPVGSAGCDVEILGVFYDNCPGSLTGCKPSCINDDGKIVRDPVTPN